MAKVVPLLSTSTDERRKDSSQQHQQHQQRFNNAMFYHSSLTNSAPKVVPVAATTSATTSTNTNTSTTSSVARSSVGGILNSNNNNNNHHRQSSNVFGAAAMGSFELLQPPPTYHQHDLEEDVDTSNNDAAILSNSSSSNINNNINNKSIYKEPPMLILPTTTPADYRRSLLATPAPPIIHSSPFLSSHISSNNHNIHENQNDRVSAHHQPDASDDVYFDGADWDCGTHTSEATPSREAAVVNSSNSNNMTSITPPSSFHSVNSAKSLNADSTNATPDVPESLHFRTSSSLSESSVAAVAGNHHNNNNNNPSNHLERYTANKKKDKNLNLYSAIGSLENPTSSSYGSLKKRYLEKHTKKKADDASSQKFIVVHKTDIKKNSSSSALTEYYDGQQQQLDQANSNSVTNVNQSTSNNNPAAVPAAAATAATATLKSIDKDDTSNADTASTRKSNLKTINAKYIEKGKGDNDSTSHHRKEIITPPKTVSYDRNTKGRRKSKDLFRPSSDAYTPRTERKTFKFKPAEKRTAVHKNADPLGPLQRPNFRDALKRVSMIIHQHVVKIEQRFESGKQQGKQGLFKNSMKDLFSEDNYCTPTYKCTMVRIPMARAGMVYGLKKIKVKHQIPSEAEIFEFAHQLFHSVQLSSECSIVCLIYIERLMEAAKVPLLACTWRPIFMCGLLLASKVWQDLSSWNVEFASVYPQYSRDSINKLELNFLRMVNWDLYIGSSLYAKYYFALRALVEKRDFRQRYNRMVGGVAHSEGLKIQQRTEQVKEEALLQLSRSM